MHRQADFNLWGKLTLNTALSILLVGLMLHPPFGLCALPKRRFSEIDLGGINVQKSEPSMTFGLDGLLYFAYREENSIGVLVINVDERKVLRATHIQVPKIDLPSGGSELKVSPDGSFLAYSESDTCLPLSFLAVLRTRDLSVISSAQIARTADGKLQYPAGFSADTTAIMVYSVTRRSPSDHRVTIIYLDPNDLNHILDRKTADVYDGVDSHVVMDLNGAVWLYSNKKVDEKIFWFDPIRDQTYAGPVFSLRPTGQIGQSVALNDSILALTSELTDKNGAFGRILRSPKDHPGSLQESRINGCGFEQVSRSMIAPDQLFAVANCKAVGTTEFTFLPGIVNDAVVFNTRSLAVVGRFGLAKDEGPVALAVWHGDGQVVVANTDPKHNKIQIHSYPRN